MIILDHLSCRMGEFDPVQTRGTPSFALNHNIFYRHTEISPFLVALEIPVTKGLSCE